MKKMNKKTKELNRINELDKQVNSENDAVLTDIVCYIRGANISEYDQEVIRQDLLEMILSAQKRDEDIQSVIGGDYKEFCDEIIASLPPRSIGQKVLEFVDIICLCMSILLVINIAISSGTIKLIKSIITGGPLNFEISISAGNFISWAIIIVVAFVIVGSIMKNSFQISNKPSSIIKISLLNVCLTSILVLIAWIGRTTLFTVNIFVLCGAALTLYITHKILERV